MILLALIQLDTFVCNGGGLAEVARAIAEARDAPVAVLSVARPPIYKPMRIKFLDEPNLINRIGRELGLEAEGRKLYAFAPEAWPERLFNNRGMDWGFNEVEEWPAKANPDGTVTIRSRKGAFLVQRKLEGPWPKPVVANRFYEKLQVVVAATNADPKRVLQTIAAAIGAKATFGETEWSLDFDGKEFRRRLVSLLAVRIRAALPDRTGALQVADAKLCIAALDTLSDAQLEETAKNSGGRVTLQVQPGTALCTAMKERLVALSNTPMGFVGGGTGTDITKKLDLDRPVQIVLTLENAKAWIQGKVKGDPKGGITF